MLKIAQLAFFAYFVTWYYDDVYFCCISWRVGRWAERTLRNALFISSIPAHKSLPYTSVSTLLFLNHDFPQECKFIIQIKKYFDNSIKPRRATGTLLHKSFSKLTTFKVPYLTPPLKPSKYTTGRDIEKSPVIHSYCHFWKMTSSICKKCWCQGSSYLHWDCRNRLQEIVLLLLVHVYEYITYLVLWVNRSVRTCDLWYYRLQ